MVVKQSEPKNLRVLLIGFNPVVRAGLQAILAKDQGIEVMGDSADGREALPQLKQHYAQGRPIDVVLKWCFRAYPDILRETNLG